MTMTGLRTGRGVSVADLPADVIDWDFVKTNPAYFTLSESRLKMTDSGIVILDALLPKVIA